MTLEKSKIIAGLAADTGCVVALVLAMFSGDWTVKAIAIGALYIGNQVAKLQK